MEERTLNILEYDKILEMLSGECQSSLGAVLAGQLRPFTSLAEIQRAQDATEAAVDLLVEKGSPPLFGIHDIKEHMELVKKGRVLHPGVLLTVADGLRVSAELKQYVLSEEDAEQSKPNPISDLIADLYSSDYIEKEIYRCILSEDEIADEASRELFSIRRKLRQKNEAIKNKLQQIIRSRGSNIIQEEIVTIREGRYVVPIKSSGKGHFPGIVHDQSASGATLFVEPMVIVEMNNELRMLETEEAAEIERILKRLTELIKVNVDSIIDNQDILQELDFNFAKARLGLRMKATRPEFNDEGRVKFISARHPLLQGKVVPIDIHFGEEFSTLVITGPNTGGKTVALKTVGLLLLMAESGLQIPCEEGTHVSLFDEIYADIGDKQSIEQSLSTFSASMKNIVDILVRATSNSLVLFDELGAGTDPTEGAALAMAVLNDLLERKITTLATTHYSQLKLYAISTPGVKNASVEFDVNTLSPTYRLIIGMPGKSNAFEISGRLGLSESIIRRASSLIDKENKEFEEIIAGIESDRIEIEQYKSEIKRRKQELEILQGKLERDWKASADQKEKVIAEAKTQAQEIISEAKDYAASVARELKKLKHANISDIDRTNYLIQAESRERLDRYKEKKKEKKRTHRPIGELKLGEEVKILSMDQNGQVMTLPDRNGNLQVQVGILKFTVHRDDIAQVEASAPEKTKAHYKNIIRDKASVHISSELDLRGMISDDALLSLDKYIDDAFLVGMKEIRIIHGKGTGALRRSVTEHLKTHRSVKSFKYGNENEGGDGVTIAKLK